MIDQHYLNVAAAAISTTNYSHQKSPRAGGVGLSVISQCDGRHGATAVVWTTTAVCRCGCGMTLDIKRDMGGGVAGKRSFGHSLTPQSLATPSLCQTPDAPPAATATRT